MEKAGAAVIPVTRLRGEVARFASIVNSTGAEVREVILAALPPDGVILSGDEVAQIRLALTNVTGEYGPWLSDSGCEMLQAALTLLDSVGEETG